MLSWFSFGKKKDKEPEKPEKPEETEEEKKERRKRKREAALAENAARAEAAQRRKNPINVETNKDWATDEDMKRLQKGELTDQDDILHAKYDAGQEGAEKRSEELFRKMKPFEIEKDPKIERMKKQSMEEQVRDTMLGGRRRKRTRRRKKKSKKKKNKKSKKRRKRKRKSTKKKRRRRKSRK